MMHVTTICYARKVYYELSKEVKIIKNIIDGNEWLIR